MRKLYLIFITALAASIPATAEPNAAKGFGAQTCAVFANNYKLAPSTFEVNYFSWAQGFMTGLNVAAPSGAEHDLNATSIEAQQEFLRNYCDQHPLQDYVTGVMQLWSSLPRIPAR